MFDCRKIYLGLVHYPISNKNGDEVTTSVTNLDIHDIARSVKTFGPSRYFIITPIEKQQALVQRILGHWESEKASDYNPDRHDAVSMAQVVKSVEQAVENIEALEGRRPFVAITGANYKNSTGGELDLMEKIEIDNCPCLLLFGTGWGLHDRVVKSADFVLNPILGGPDGYNHLSVRSAVAIYLDRIARVCDRK